MNTLFEQITINATRGPDRVSPFFVPMAIANVGAGQLSITFGAMGPNFAVVSACATGGHAIGEAWEIIRRGDAEVMVAGGAEAGVQEALVAGFCAMRALSTRNDDPIGASRPFDVARDGFVIGEGCGILVLEELEHARSRGVEPLAELIGYGATADASHITLPAPGGSGAVRAARRALEKAGLTPAAIDHLNAHATSTEEGDKAELMAIRTIFGDHAPDVAVTANKSMLGHTLGAAGAIEAIATIQSIRTGIVPPTINLTDPDPLAEGLDLTPLVASRREVRTALSNSFGFGGQNTALVFTPVRRMTEQPDSPAAAIGAGSPADQSLLGLVDHLAALLERSELTELEVEAGGTGLVLRKPAALRPSSTAGPGAEAAAGLAAPASAAAAGAAAPGAAADTARPSVKAPLTGIFYASPSPGSAAYVQAGGEVAVGQVIGLIEAMKLFNEIKSDLAGRVVRVVAESGQLVKAKQPLVEVEPL